MDPKAANVRSVHDVQSAQNVKSVNIVQSVPTVQSGPNVVQSAQSQEQEFNEILRELNLESLPPNVKNALDLDFILEGDHIFPGEPGAFPGAYVSTEVKNTWMIKAMIQYPGMDSLVI